MNVLILQHENSTPPGSTIEWCETRNHTYRICWAQDPLPTQDSFELLVICGGGMNVDQEDRHPWLKAEKAFILEAVQRKKFVVGLCLGGQLLAEVLGGQVGRHPHWEVGWQTVNLKTGEKLKVFQWHGYSFTLPPGAELWASNEACQHQAFTWGRRVLAFQFHPETTREWALQCSESKNLPTTGFVQTVDEIIRDSDHQPKLQAWYFVQLDQLTES